MNKLMKFTVVFLTVISVLTSCKKNEITFDARYSTGMALVQLHNELPVPANVANVADYNFYKVELNGVDLACGKRVPLNSWSSIPAAVRYYEVNPGTANIKLYQQVGSDLVLKYDQSVTLKEGKQGLILYDFNKPPIVITEEDNILPYRVTVDTDTVHYVRFFNLMREKPGEESNLKLQYQFQYSLHPLYTLDDLAAGKIPAGKKVGDADPQSSSKKSPWINLGPPVGFGENTGWQMVMVKKETYVSQGQGRVDYRIVVTQGGVVGVTMTAGDNLLICRNRAATSLTNGFTDYWTSYVGRWAYHFFSGYRDGGAPGMAIAQPFFQK